MCIHKLKCINNINKTKRRMFFFHIYRMYIYIYIFLLAVSCYKKSHERTTVVKAMAFHRGYIVLHYTGAVYMNCAHIYIVFCRLMMV